MNKNSGSVRKRPVLLTGGLLLICLFGYQNCTEGGGLTQSSRQASELASQNSTEHPYEFGVDTLAYSSCTFDFETDAKDVLRRGYFTFKVGAYHPQSGLRVNPNYIAKFNKPTAQAITDKLLSLSEGKESDVVLSMRKRSDLRYTVVPGNVAEDAHFGATKFQMGRPTTTGQLAELISGDYLRILKFRDANDRVLFGEYALKRFEAQFAMVGGGKANEKFHQAIRNGLASRNGGVSENLLTMSFSQGTTSDSLLVSKTPADSANTLMGKGFRLQFSALNDPESFEGLSSMGRAVASVAELDLSNANPTPQPWRQCLPPLQVVQWVDAIADFTGVDGQPIASPCPILSDEDNVKVNGAIDSKRQESLAIIRRMLPVENWYVNLAANCVVPKQMSREGDRCYHRGLRIVPAPPRFREVAYRMPQSNFTPEKCTTLYDDSVTNQNLPLCPHFVSVCVKY